MKKGRKHINQKLNESYPKPEVPADASWAMMNEMLNAGMPTKNPINWSKFFLSTIACMLIGGLAAYYFWPKTTSDNLRKETVKKNVEQQNSAGKNVKNRSNTSADSLGHYQDTVFNLKGDLEEINKKPISSERDANHRSLQANTDKTGLSTPAGSNESTTILAKTNKKHNRIDQSSTSERNGQKVDKAKKRVYQTTQSESEQILTKPDSQKSEVTTKPRSVRATQNDIFDVELLENRSVNFKNLLSYPRIGVNPDARNQKAQLNKPPGSLLRNTGIALQWQSAIPFSGTNYFLKSGDNNSAYQLLIPGLSISQNFGQKSAVRFTFLPYGQYFTKDILVSNTTTEQADSSTIVTNQTSLVKTRGWNAGFSYERVVLKNFEIAAGIFIHKQGHSLLSSETVTANDSTSSFQSELINRKYAATDGYTNQYLFTASLEAFYTYRKIQFGTGVFIPLTSMTPIITNVRPLNGKVFIRWRLK